RVACDKALRYVVDQVAFLSLGKSEWARAYYDQQRARGHDHHPALRALGAKWLKIIFVMWDRQIPYDEQHHLATMTRQQLRQRGQKKVAGLGPEKVSHAARCGTRQGVGALGEVRDRDRLPRWRPPLERRRLPDARSDRDAAELLDLDAGQSCPHRALLEWID